MTVPYSDFSDVTLVRTDANFYSGIGKRLFDLTVVIMTAPIVLPVLALILIVSAFDGGWPLYIQRRIGRGGREFHCWKVRTMVHGADAVLADLVRTDPQMAREWAENQKLTKDPRITSLGRMLRRTSLDELPQLWNVLNGTMSLIGPRPFTPDQRELYANGRADAPYYSMRPGISGLWQVSRRNAGSFAERAHYDQEYGLRLSFGFDLSILWCTIAVVLRATGL